LSDFREFSDPSTGTTIIFCIFAAIVFSSSGCYINEYGETIDARSKYCGMKKNQNEVKERTLSSDPNGPEN